MAKATISGENQPILAGMPLKLNLHGRFMCPDETEFPCKLIRISLSHAGLLIGDCQRTTIRKGDSIIAYIDEIGRIEGIVTDKSADGFQIELQQTKRQRSKLATKIDWLAQFDSSEIPEQRRYSRFVPKNTQAILTLDDGSQHECKILDLSLSGAAVETELRPTLQSEITLVSSKGKVVRYFDEGIGIEFFMLTTEISAPE